MSQKARTALIAPLKLDKCIRIADSQYNGMPTHTAPLLSSNLLLAYLDDILDLTDPDLFYDRIMAELVARSPQGTQDSQQSVRNASHIASVVSTRYRLCSTSLVHHLPSLRIHNAYMVASGWKLVVDTLRDLQNSGLNDATARTQLQSDVNLRSRYLILCDIVGVLVDLGQAHFSILAMTTRMPSQSPC